MKFTLKQIQSFIKKLPHTLGEHAFPFTLSLVALAFLISAFLFVSYVLPAQEAIGESPVSESKFRKGVFEQVLEYWKVQDKQFHESGSLAPRPIFRYNPSASP